MRSILLPRCNKPFGPLAATGDAATGFACLVAFLACLVAENWHRVERERSDLLAALPQPVLKAA